MSLSKRPFLRNYFETVGKEYPTEKKLYLEEENREGRYPIYEGECGTEIYTDDITEMYAELPVLSPYLRRGIISSRDIDDALFFTAIRDYKRLTEKNVTFLKESLYREHPDKGLSSGYLYRKTSDRKEYEET